MPTKIGVHGGGRGGGWWAGVCRCSLCFRTCPRMWHLHLGRGHAGRQLSCGVRPSSCLPAVRWSLVSLQEIGGEGNGGREQGYISVDILTFLPTGVAIGVQLYGGLGRCEGESEARVSRGLRWGGGGHTPGHEEHASRENHQRKPTFTQRRRSEPSSTPCSRS